MGNRPPVHAAPGPEWSFWFDTYAPPTPWSLSRQPRRIRAGWKKALAALILMTVTVTAGWGFLVHPLVTARVVILTLGVLSGAQLIRWFLWWERFGHDRTVVRPLACRTAGVLDQAVGDRRAWLTVPWDYRINIDAKIEIKVPADFTAAERDMEDLTRAVTVSTGWAAPQVETVLRSRHPRLVYSQNKPPPAGVSLADIRPYIERASHSQVVPGLATGFEPIYLDLDSETPMLGFSMTTGDGKSEAAKNIAVQVLYHGGIVMILDYKLVSHMWADRLPNVSYARTPQEIQEALMWLAWDEYDEDGNIVRPSELTRRKQVVLAARRAGETPNPGPRLLILAEERNATNRVLNRFHKRLGGKGASPALQAADETGETGRQVRVNKLDVAQRLSAKASGSDGTRDAMENIGAIITKDPTEQTWKLIGGGHAQPPRSGHKGRYQLITKAGVTEFQGVLYDDDPAESDRLAAELALSGTIGQVPHDMPFVWRGPLLVPTGSGHELPARQEAPERAFGSTQEPGVLTVGEGPRRAVTCAEMAAAGLFVSKGAAAKQAYRQGWKIVGGDKHTTGWTYDLGEVYEYLNGKAKR